MKSLLNIQFLAVFAWSVTIRFLIWPLAKFISLFSDHFRDQIRDRPETRDVAILLANTRRNFDRCVVFFCSSAGEFEQAKPIIDRLASQGGVLCHVFFFSVSGAEFVKARREKVSWSLCPPDDIWNWGDLFSALRPSSTIVVRHEVWPAFLWIASSWCPVTMINAVVPSLWGRQAKWKERLNLVVKSRLLQFVSKVCVVNYGDKEFFEKWLRLSPDKIVLTGDTKYDRVFERALLAAGHVDHLREQFCKKWNPVDCQKILICGSVHIADIDLILPALEGQSLNAIKVLVVPHDVAPNNVALIFEKIRYHQFSCELLSDVSLEQFKFERGAPRFIVVDEMGRLSDLYGVADFAWVGGAVHAKIHNVLEPAAWGLAISCGTHYQNSPEAVLMKAEGYLFPTQDASQLKKHWTRLLSQHELIGKDTASFAKSLTGATEKILMEINVAQRVVERH